MFYPQKEDLGKSLFGLIEVVYNLLTT